MAVVLQTALPQTEPERAWEIYRNIRSQVETPENLGKLLAVDLVSGEFVIVHQGNGLAESDQLSEGRPDAVLMKLRIGYQEAFSLDGFLQRLPE